MKALHFATFALLFLLSASAQVPKEFRVTGIIRVNGTNTVLCENRGRGESLWLNEKTTLSKGESILVTAIEPETGSVIVQINEIESRIQLAKSAPESAGSFVILERAGLLSFLNLYVQLQKRNALVTPNIAKMELTMALGASNDEALLAKLEKELLNHDVAAANMGEKFVVVSTKATAAKVASGLEKFNAPNLAPAKTNEFDKGWINFIGAPVIQVSEIFADLCDHQLDRKYPPEALSFSEPRIHFTTVNKLTPGEGMFAIETLLAWNGFHLEPVGDKTLKLVYTKP